jgi:hypothetical protein
VLQHNQHNVYPYLYLFIMDLCRIPLQDFKTYEEYEPGFAVPFLQAYITAFKEDMNGTLSHALLKKINTIAMSHQSKGEGVVQYRNIPGNFMISFETYTDSLNIGYSATLSGLREFISYWIEQQKSNHQLSFQLKSNPFTDSFAITSENSKSYWCKVTDRVVTKEEFDLEKHFPQIALLSSTIKHEFYINTMVFAPGSKESIQDKVEQGMQKIFDAFHAEIALADDKVPTIAKYIQRINQLHPFVDGNIRTCYVLLNKLLSDYGLPLTILLNPNKLDACSLDEVIHMIRDGQVIYQQLMSHTDPKKFEIKTKEQIHALKLIKCPPNDLKLQELLNEFYHSFIHREQGSGLSKATAQRFFVSNKDFSCALRNACNKRELEIIKELLDSNKTIDVNQQSSNGNTALDWFDMSRVAVDPDLLIEVREILVAKGAENNKFEPPMPVLAKSPTGT